MQVATRRKIMFRIRSISGSLVVERNLLDVALRVNNPN